LVIVPHGTHKHSHPAWQPVQLSPGITGIFKTFPYYFQEKTLLGIDAPGFQRRNMKQERVKTIDIP
jgi:hypothetical protein